MRSVFVVCCFLAVASAWNWNAGIRKLAAVTAITTSSCLGLPSLDLSDQPIHHVFHPAVAFAAVEKFDGVEYMHMDGEWESEAAYIARQQKLREEAASSTVSTVSTATDTAKPVPAITSQAYLDISIARQKPQRVTLGLYGKDAPGASKFFLSVCKGDYGDGVSYDGSQVSLVQKDELITVGKLAYGGGKATEIKDGKIRAYNLAERFVNTDSNELKHDMSGLVSVPKQGGTFEFNISPKPNLDLDEDNLVIGQVMQGMEVIDEINNIPVSREDGIGSKTAFSSAGKGFDPRAKLITLNRPLRQVKILQCQVEGHTHTHTHTPPPIEHSPIEKKPIENHPSSDINPHCLNRY